jgi:hypothetical protein
MSVSIFSSLRGTEFVVTFEVVLENNLPRIKVNRKFREDGVDGVDEYNGDGETWFLEEGFVWIRSVQNNCKCTNVGIKCASISGIAFSIWGVEGVGSSAFEYWIENLTEEDVTKLQNVEDALFDQQLNATPNQLINSFI